MPCSVHSLYSFLEKEVKTSDEILAEIDNLNTYFKNMLEQYPDVTNTRVYKHGVSLTDLIKRFILSGPECEHEFMLFESSVCTKCGELEQENGK